ncbi:MAG: hypothetical protein ACRD4U_04780 [Candidatus Acidiferrales bacterium]
MGGFKGKRLLAIGGVAALAVGAVIAATYLTRSEPLVVPAGTVLTVRLTTALSSKTNEPGDDFVGVIDRDVMVGDKVAIPAGSEVNGTVIQAEASGRLKQRAKLALTLSEVEVDGETYEVTTTATGGQEGSKLKRNILFIGGGAGLGTLIGGLAGGGKGAAIGAGVGAGGGTAGAALTGQRDIRYPSETRLRFRLKEDLEVEQ